MQAFDSTIANLMPADMAEAYRKECAERDARLALYAEKVRVNSAEAIALLSDAIVRPNISKQTLKDALGKVLAAVAAAEILDPED